MTLRVLFVMSTHGNAREVQPVVEGAVLRGHDVRVVLGWAGPTADEYSAACSALGATVVAMPARFVYGSSESRLTSVAEFGAAENGEPAPERTSSFRRAGRRAKLGAYSAGQFIRLLRDGWAVRRWAAKLIEDFAPEVVFGGSYRSVGTFDQAFARATREAGTLYCCVPLGPYLGQANAILNRYHWLDHGMITRRDWTTDERRSYRLLSRIRPRWTARRGDTTLFAFPPRAMVAAHIAGLMPSNPWQQPSEDYDLCFVESAFSKDLLLASDFPAEKIVVAGKPLLDVVFERLRDPEAGASLYRSLGLAEGTPFLLCNVEPTYEHQYASWDDHWERFRGLMTTLAETQLDVVLSLHPLCDPDDYRFVEEEFGFRVADEQKIFDLFPYCGLCVSFPCSTNPTALIFDTPLVVYDWIGLARAEVPGSERYRLPGAKLAHTLAEVRTAVAEIAEDPAFGAVRARAADTRPSAVSVILDAVDAKVGRSRSATVAQVVRP